MCATCGCDELVHHHDHDPGSEHAHDHGPDDDHDHDHDHAHAHAHIADRGPVDARHVTTIRLEQDLLARNSRRATRNRGYFAERGIVALNLVSSPGAGKTTLLERTLREVGAELGISVLEGDQETTRDAERIRAAGAKAVQINTGTGCHLDAEMIRRGLLQLAPAPGSVVMIENVGNLVCPALFDLGEHAKVLILSVTEGEDKPLKYPHMFRAADLLILNKIDLLPYVAFDVERCLDYARQVHPGLPVLCVSSTRGDGLAAWYGWLRSQGRRALEQAAAP
jgi:hydrogenase nickel incorporation protein HypB